MGPSAAGWCEAFLAAAALDATRRGTQRATAPASTRACPLVCVVARGRGRRAPSVAPWLRTCVLIRRCCGDRAGSPQSWVTVTCCVTAAATPSVPVPGGPGWLTCCGGGAGVAQTWCAHAALRPSVRTACGAVPWIANRREVRPWPVVWVVLGAFAVTTAAARGGYLAVLAAGAARVARARVCARCTWRGGGVRSRCVGAGVSLKLTWRWCAQPSRQVSCLAAARRRRRVGGGTPTTASRRAAANRTALRAAALGLGSGGELGARPCFVRARVRLTRLLPPGNGRAGPATTHWSVVWVVAGAAGGGLSRNGTAEP